MVGDSSKMAKRTLSSLFIPRTAMSFRIVASVVLGVAALGLGLGVFLWLASMKQAPTARYVAAKIYNVDVFDVEQADLREIITGFGVPRADREVVVSAQVSGEVLESHIEEGQHVSGAEVKVGSAGQSDRFAGDLLVVIDPETYEDRVAQATSRLELDDAELKQLKQQAANNEVQLANARADYKIAEEDFERVKQAGRNNAITPSRLAQAQLEFRGYENTVLKFTNEQKLFPLRSEVVEKRKASNRVDQATAQLNLDRTQIRPPFSGWLSEVMTERGQYVRVGEPLLRLTDTSKVEIPVALPMSDFARVQRLIQRKERPRVRLLHESTGNVWTGIVERVSPEADELTRTATVYVVVDNAEQTTPLLPKNHVVARIEGPMLKNLIVLPRDAIRNGGVFVAKKDHVTFRPVTVKRTLQNLAVIESGLETDERVYVVLTNLDVLHEGAKIEVQSHRDLDDELDRQRGKVARPLVADGRAAEDGAVN